MMILKLGVFTLCMLAALAIAGIAAGAVNNVVLGIVVFFALVYGFAQTRFGHSFIFWLDR